MSRHLSARRVHARYPAGEWDALRDLSLTVYPGEILALVGPNGSGKSTALAVLGRCLAPRLGAVRLDGADPWGLSHRRFARAVARLPQHPSCAEGLTVEDLVCSGRTPHRRFLGPPSRADHAAVRAALRATDLLDLRHRRMETLSGGERRRAWLATVLAQEAAVLLLDEPTAALDLRYQSEILELLRRLTHGRQITIVVVLHDLEQAARLADRIAVMHRGRLYEVGPPDRCIHEDMLRDVFGVAARLSRDEGRLRICVRGPCTPTRHL
jgi:iron complex transport system ATP-binding protein